MGCYLGIDLGTSGVKAIVMDDQGTVLGSGLCECDVLTPQPGWVEQNPEMWWEACSQAVKQAVKACGCGQQIEAVGFSGQMQGLVMLDKSGEVLDNCIIWLDQRAQKQTEEIEAQIPHSEYLEKTANGVLNSFFAPKLMWVRENRPEIYERIWRVFFPKDYIRYRMTGEVAAEVSDASLSFLMNVPDRCWEKSVFEALDLPVEIVPENLLESTDIAGFLLADVAEAWGLRPGIPVVAGGGDQPAGGVGTGVVRQGILGATIGTSGVIFGSTEEPLIDTQGRALMTMAHSARSSFCFLGLVLTAGGAFKWLRDTVFAAEKKTCAEKGTDIYDYMTNLAQKAPPGSEGLLFQPYLNGEKTPVSDPDARATFFGLSQRHGLPEMCRSVMEGVTYALRDTVEICREFGIPVEEIRVNGGGAKSPLWRQIQADIYDADVVRMNLEEGPAAGAAIMAAVGAGRFKNVEEACDAVLKVTDVTHPDPANVQLYNEYYAMYRDLYKALRPLFPRQAALVAKYL